MEKIPAAGDAGGREINPACCAEINHFWECSLRHSAETPGTARRPSIWDDAGIVRSAWRTPGQNHLSPRAPKRGRCFTKSVSLVLALVLGLLTQRLRLSPIVGYLLAGVAVGPHTPGFEADPKMAAQLAEIGVILLMFGVGLRLDLRELLAVRRVAVPGAVGQSVVATVLGLLVRLAGGLGAAAGLVLGLAVSVASTVVLVRVLLDNDVLHSRQGHIAVGWLIVEDIFTVLVLVALPALAGAFGQPGGDPSHQARTRPAS